MRIFNAKIGKHIYPKNKTALKKRMLGVNVNVR